MRWLNAFIKRRGGLLILLLLFLQAITCNHQPKPDCEQIVKIGKNMAQTDIINYGATESMFPETYCAGYIDHIFAVPEPNAIGTNDLDNAVKVLTFKPDNELEEKTIKKDFLEMVSGPFDFRFLPVVSDEEIAYSQTRGFIIVNVKKKDVAIHTIEWKALTGSDIGNVAILDGKTKTFVFEMWGESPYSGENSKVLRVLRFTNDKMDTLGERPAGVRKLSYTEPWFVYNGTIFIYTDSTTKLEAFDANFKPVRHALAEAFNALKSFRSMLEIVVHPTLPFAILVEVGKFPDLAKLQEKFKHLPPIAQDAATEPFYKEANRHVLYLFRWTHPDEKQRLLPIVSDVYSIWDSYKPGSYSNFTFSPDGKWLVFRDETGASNNPNFMAVPISEKKDPLYLGKPINLGRVMRKESTGPTGTAWATGPTAFVMSDGAAIYKWNLGSSSSMRRVNAPAGQTDPRLGPNFGR
jgi:outer membrane protein assembly factor BamB